MSSCASATCARWRSFPLRGSFRIIDQADPVEHDATGIPAPGTVWISQAGAETLEARLGDSIGIGDIELRLTALVVQEPDASLDYFNVAPKAFLNLADLPATGLVQPGSRLGYRVVVAGDATAVERFVATARPALGRGQRLETIQDARPEVRSSLDRAGRFLGLAALVSVVLAAVAVAMAARRHSERHLSGTAVMRCLGASQRTLVGIHVGELVLLGLTVGALTAYALKRLLASEYFGAEAWQRQVADQLYGVKGTDPLTFAVIASLLTLVALVACWLPARKAAQVDPLESLRQAVARRGSFWRTLRAVAWAFFGVRKARDLDRDSEELNPVHVIIAGVIGAVLFVAGLLALVGWVLSSGVAA